MLLKWVLLVVFWLGNIVLSSIFSSLAFVMAFKCSIELIGDHGALPYAVSGIVFATVFATLMWSGGQWIHKGE